MKLKTTCMLLALAICVLIIGAHCSRDKPEDEAAENAAAKKDRIVQTYATPAPGSGGQPGPGFDAACGLPGMIDLGKGTCIPCRKMAPFLKELRQTYDGRAAIAFIDLDDDKSAAQR